jgi:tetratricopeptide (TPR) repeat protein
MKDKTADRANTTAVAGKRGRGGFWVFSGAALVFVSTAICLQRAPYTLDLFNGGIAAVLTAAPLVLGFFDARRRVDSRWYKPSYIFAYVGLMIIFLLSVSDYRFKLVDSIVAGIACFAIRAGWADRRSARARNMGLTFEELDSIEINERGVARKASGDIEGAIEDFTQAISLNPSLAEAFSNRGNARFKNGDLDGALKDYEEALRLKPDDAGVYYNRAIVWEDKSNPAAAISDFQKYLDLGAGERAGDAEEVNGFIRELKKKL